MSKKKEPKNHCIYEYKHKTNKKKVYYIGQRNRPNTARIHKVNGIHANKFTIKVLHKNLTQKQANKLERLEIKKHNSIQPNGYNKTKGGKTGKGTALSGKNNPNYGNGVKISGRKNPMKRPEVAAKFKGEKNPICRLGTQLKIAETRLLKANQRLIKANNLETRNIEKRRIKHLQNLIRHYKSITEKEFLMEQKIRKNRKRESASEAKMGIKNPKVKWAAKRRNLTLKQYARKRIEEYELYLSKPQTRKNKGVKRKRVIKALKTMKRVLKEVA